MMTYYNITHFSTINHFNNHFEKCKFYEIYLEKYFEKNDILAYETQSV